MTLHMATVTARTSKNKMAGPENPAISSFFCQESALADQ